MPPRRVTPGPTYRFFGGKGGVGKTTCAAAAAVGHAEHGRRVLVVSTDPAHSLGDALQVALASEPRTLPVRRGSLTAVELDADRALRRWLGGRRRWLELIAERGTYLDEHDVDQLFRLSLPGVDELVGLLELTRLARAGNYTDVIVDTAPTGHTLRLLTTPDTLRRLAGVLDEMLAKHRFLAQSLGGSYRPDRADRVIADIDAQGQALTELLRDSHRCQFQWVLLPEQLSVQETRDGIAALDEAGIAVEQLIVNRVTAPPPEPCPLCYGRMRAERAAIADVHALFGDRPIRFLRSRPREPRGLVALRSVYREISAPSRGHALLAYELPPRPRSRAPAPRRGKALTETLGNIVRPELRLLIFGGKGGVGKTTSAAAVAAELSRRAPERRVLLLSADPAHSLGDVLQVEVDDTARALKKAPGRLEVRELDAHAAFALERERYREAVDEIFDTLRGRSRFDAVFDRAVVQSLIDLAPPGLDEIFAMLAVLDATLADPAERPVYDLLVLDTAPTGHALRLLALPDAALEWVRALLAILLKYREVTGLGGLAQDLVDLSRRLRALVALLRDPVQTRFVAVTRPAELPRVETERLLDALDALKVPLAGIVVNSVTPPGCSRCRRVSREEGRQITALRERTRSRRGRRCAMIMAPAVVPPPRGIDSLLRWVACWTEIEA